MWGYLWGTSGVHSLYVPRLFSMHFYGDHVQLWPVHPMPWRQLYRQYEHQPKICSFFYLGQVVPSSESGPARSYRLSKTIMSDAFFSGISLTNKKNNRFFLLWASDQKHGRGTEVDLTCLFLWHMNVNSVIFGSISHQAHSVHIQLSKISTNMFGNTIPPRVW